MKRKQPPREPNSSEPATQEDLALWGGQITDHVMSVKEEVTGHILLVKEELIIRIGQVKDELTTRIDKVEQGQERILEIVQSIDAHVKELRDLPRRMEKVEADVFQLKLKTSSK
jgi:hypothetical protein